MATERIAVHTDDEAVDSWMTRMGFVAAMIALPVAVIGGFVAWLRGDPEGPFVIGLGVGMLAFIGVWVAVFLWYVGKIVFFVFWLYFRVLRDLAVLRVHGSGGQFRDSPVPQAVRLIRTECAVPHGGACPSRPAQARENENMNTQVRPAGGEQR